ncbi:MAG: hypothetical protein IT261_12955, partial [Saprospiraceae bacterium]|nr:hypothetical protein [Saprospiraceae bacterium]
MVNCSFIENESAGNGGAVFLGDAARSDTMDIIHCLFEKNFSKSIGGGIFTGGTPNGTYMQVVGTRFFGNKAKVGSGFCLYSEENPINKITFDSCTFDGNTFYVNNPLATPFAAAFEIYSGYYNPGNGVRRLISIRNCKFENHEGHTM